MAISAIVAAISTATTALTGGALISFGLTGFAGIASHFLVTTALGAALNALTPQPSQSGLGGYGVNAVGSNLDRQIIYGQTRVASAVVYSDTFGSSNKNLEQVHVFSGHPIDSFVEFYIDGNRVTDVDPSTGAVLEVELQDGTTSDIYKKHAYILGERLGDETTPAFPDLKDKYSGEGTPEDYWNSDCYLTNCAAVHTKFVWNTNTQIWPNGLPKFEALIKGKKVFDPRSGTTEWSDNAALCIADYLLSDYGLDEDPYRIDMGMVSTAANVCAQTASDGTTRYTFNGAFLTNVTPSDWLATALMTMGGSLWYAQGKWRMKPAYWTTPVIEINEDHLRSQISLNTRHSRRDNYNQVKGTFRGPETFYQVTSFPTVQNHTPTGSAILPQNFVMGEFYQIRALGAVTDWNIIAGTTGVTYNVGDTFRCAIDHATGDGDAYATYDFFLEVDNGQRSAISLDLPFVDNSPQCKRVSRIALERNREQLTISFTTNLHTLPIQVGDNVEFSYERFGWVNKEFELVAWGMTLNETEGEGFEPLINLTLRETSEESFDDKDDGEIYENNNTRLPNPFTMANPINLAFSSTSSIDEDGKSTSDVTLSWDHPDIESVSTFDLEYRKFGDTEWTPISGIRGRTSKLLNVNSEQLWEWRLLARNVIGSVSSWVVGPNAAGTPDTTVPKAPDNLVSQGSYRAAFLKWDIPTKNTDETNYKDHSHFILRRDDLPSTDVRIEADGYTDASLGTAIAYTYKVKAVDRSGNESVWSTVTNVTTLADPADGVDGISVLIVYADDAAGNNQSLTAGSREFVSYVEYNTAGAPPPLPVTATFVKFVGTGQGIWPIYADDALGGNQSFVQGTRPYVNFYERAGGPPTLPRFQDEEGNPLAWVRVAADDGNDGSDAIGIRLSVDDQTITYNDKGQVDPSSQTFNFEAFGQNIGTNTISWSTSPNVGSGTGTTFQLDQNDFGTQYKNANKVITVTASVTVNSVVYKDKVSVHALKQGSGSFVAILGNPTVTVPSAFDGAGPDLTGTDTTVNLYQGIREFTATGSLPNSGEFRVLSTVYEGSTGPNTGTPSGNTIAMGDITSFTQDKGYRIFTVQFVGFDSDTLETLEIRQTYSKSKTGSSGVDGDRGPGRWDIVLPNGVSLPTSNSQFDNYWNTYGRSNGNNAPVRPVVNDQAWYRTPQGAQSVGICQTVSSNTSHTWEYQEEVIDGDLLVTGTVNTMDAAIGGIIQSANYSTSLERGWQIRDTGAATFYGPVISRDLLLSSGRFDPKDYRSGIPSNYRPPQSWRPEFDNSLWFTNVNTRIRCAEGDLRRLNDLNLYATAWVDPNGVGDNDGWGYNGQYANDRSNGLGWSCTAIVTQPMRYKGYPQSKEYDTDWTSNKESGGGTGWDAWTYDSYSPNNAPTTYLPNRTGSGSRVLLNINVRGLSKMWLPDGPDFTPRYIYWAVYINS